MDEVGVDHNNSSDNNTSKRSSRPKKQKKFFDDDAMSSKSLKVKLKNFKGKSDKKSADVIEKKTNEDQDNASEEVVSQKPVDEEERWLEALEKGELDENGEIPKTRDPSLMTARQRALMSRNHSNLVEELPATIKETETEEEKMKRLEKNRKRKLQAEKKAKETQKQTIKKLIEIPKSSKERQKAANGSNSVNKPTIPMIHYHNTASSCTLSYPEGYNFPLDTLNVGKPPICNRVCSVCGDKRKYDCAKTGVPLCSLNCYKQNLHNNKTVICT